MTFKQEHQVVDMFSMQFALSSSSSVFPQIKKVVKDYPSISMLFYLYHTLSLLYFLSNPFLKTKNLDVASLCCCCRFKHLICVTETIAYPRLLEHSKHKHAFFCLCCVCVCMMKTVRDKEVTVQS